MAALDWAFNRTDVHGSAKAVLIVLANHADDEGKCYPGQERIAAHAGVTSRTVRDALDVLVAKGVVSISAAPGKAASYVLRMGTPENTSCPEVFSAPEAASGPEKSVIEPRKNPSGPRKQLPLNPIEPKEEPKEFPPPIIPPPLRRGTRLPADWQPDAGGVAFARSLGLDPSHVAAEFGDYWRGVPGAKGVKLDWDATFRNRCREVARRRGGGGARASPRPNAMDERLRRAGLLNDGPLDHWIDGDAA